MIPRFFADMPPRRPGLWEAQVLTTSPFRPDRVIWRRRVRGLRRAYLWARWMAFFTDLWYPDYDGELGINWAVIFSETPNP